MKDGVGIGTRADDLVQAIEGSLFAVENRHLSRQEEVAALGEVGGPGTRYRRARRRPRQSYRNWSSGYKYRTHMKPALRLYLCALFLRAAKPGLHFVQAVA